MKPFQRCRRLSTFLTVLLAPALLLAVTGCGPGQGKMNDVSGVVKLSGTPLKGGEVHFYPEGSKTFINTGIGEDGKYHFPNAPAGAVKITVVVLGGPPSNSAAAKTAPPPIPIPPRYQDPEKSGLTYTVVPGGQTHDIDLSS